MAKKKDKRRKAATGRDRGAGESSRSKPGKPAKVVSSELAFEVPLFKVFTDQVLEAGGGEAGDAGHDPA